MSDDEEHSARPLRNQSSKQQPTDQSQAKSAAGNRMAVCAHCFQAFNVASNPPGSCNEAPDTCLAKIENCSCMFCFERVHYLMEMQSAEPRMEHPWTAMKRCDSARVWLTAVAFSICLPGLCCYPLLRAARVCGKRAGWLGGRHVAVVRKGTTESTSAAPKPASSGLVTSQPSSSLPAAKPPTNASSGGDVRPSESSTAPPDVTSPLTVKYNSSSEA